MGVAIAWLLAPALVVVVVRRTRLLRGAGGDDVPALEMPVAGPALWLETGLADFLRGMGPSVAAALLAGSGVAALAAGSPAGAGLLLAAGVAGPAWRWPMRRRGGRGMGWGVEGAMAAALLLLLFRGSHRGSEARGRLSPVGAGRAGEAERTGGGLSSVILTLPAKPKAAVVPPPPRKRDGERTSTADAVRLSFDGVYWYFQMPDRRPRRNARVVPGDPVQANIRSVDAVPIQMEAHQRVPPEVSLASYRELVVRMRDADDRPGLIAVSLLLADASGQGPLLLGTRVLEASRRQQGYERRPATEEDLRFAIRPDARARRWTELVVRVEPERSRAQAGAHVAVVSFVLEP